VVEARLPEGAGCEPCGSNVTPDRIDLQSPEIGPVVREKLAENGFCGDTAGTPCDSYCLCEIKQYEGADLRSCQEGTAEPTNPKGYCYVDGNPGPNETDTDPAVLARRAITANCPASQQRLLRFAQEVPLKGAVAFIACLGKSLSTATATPRP
jgi:hypothetical protein